MFVAFRVTHALLLNKRYVVCGRDPERKMRAGRAERGLPGAQDCCISPHRERGEGERAANAFGREKRLAALSTVAESIG